MDAGVTFATQRNMSGWLNASKKFVNLSELLVNPTKSSHQKETSYLMRTLQIHWLVCT